MRLPWFSDETRLARLTRHAQAGDSEAFRGLYRALYPRVRRFVDRRLRSPADAEDVVASVFETVVDRLDSIRPETVSAFAVTLARNIIYDLARTRHPAEPLEMASDVASRGVDPLGRLENTEELAALAAALRTLTDPDLELVSMRLGDGLRHAEIAAVLGVSEETVRQRFRRAIGAVRESMRVSQMQGGLIHEAK